MPKKVPGLLQVKAVEYIYFSAVKCDTKLIVSRTGELY